jgi:hypothetical protein
MALTPAKRKKYEQVINLRAHIDKDGQRMHWTQISEKLGIPYRTIMRWSKLPDYQNLATELLTDWRQVANMNLADMSGLAISVLQELARNCHQPMVRYNAAAKLLDLARVDLAETKAEQQDDREDYKRLTLIIQQAGQQPALPLPEPGGKLPREIIGEARPLDLAELMDSSAP